MGSAGRFEVMMAPIGTSMGDYPENPLGKKDYVTSGGL
jgi:hypothetical protein